MCLNRVVSGTHTLSKTTDIELLTPAITKLRGSANSTHYMPDKFHSHWEKQDISINAE